MNCETISIKKVFLLLFNKKNYSQIKPFNYQIKNQSMPLQKLFIPQLFSFYSMIELNEFSGLVEWI